ncbi:HD domain-containing protein [Peribacillus simplex]|uniref:HD domain-containing protein n=1 Tax=Peribacillus simplex TaxID=1478 RepID=UPI000BA5562B|nr:HD domain-containing protein [Peribacillus simplex]PAL11329.1 hypothetical protein B8W99_17625 [Peribacillus simplex]
MSNGASIRDPIHNYIYLTEVEEEIVKHKLFQRMRFITQNGLAYFTYPSNRNDRFLHSLGCMQIGGDIFLNATNNLFEEENDTIDYLDDAYDYLRNTSSFDEAIKKYSEQNDKSFIKYGLNTLEDERYIKEYGPEKRKFARAVLFQSVRLACLLHDIGHFPFSHTVEYGFKKVIENNNPEELSEHLKSIALGKELHEAFGVKLLDVIIPEYENAFHNICRELAREILSNSNSNEIIVSLYKIVSGEIDADRLDYSLRDPYSSGLELGLFDKERLINNFAIVSYMEDDIKKFEFLPKVQALSAIESFYHQRYLTYKYLIYHHNKTRMDEIVKELSLSFIDIYFSEDEKYRDLKKILLENNFDYLWKKQNEEYYYCNENWYYELIQKFYVILDKPEIEDLELKEIKNLLEIILFRKTEHVYTYFKRYDMFHEFIEKLYNESNFPKSPLREMLKQSLPDIRIDELETEFNLEKYDYEKNITKFRKELYYVTKATDFTTFKQLIKSKYNVTLLVSLCEPKVIKMNDGISNLHLIVEKGNQKERIPVSRFSPYLETLGDSSETFKDQFLHIFIIGTEIKENDKIIEEIKQEIFTFLKDQIEKLFNVII